MNASKNMKGVLYAYIGIFVFFYVYYALAGHGERIPDYMLFLQGLYFVGYTGSLFIVAWPRFSLNLQALLIFVYSLFFAVLIRWISWKYLNKPFFGGVDSVNYDRLGIIGVSHGMSYGQYLDYLNAIHTHIDDLGMTSIVYWIYRIFGAGFSGQNALLVANAVTIAASAYPLDGIMRNVGISLSVRRFCTAAYCCMPFLSLTAAVGLKENFFVFVILEAFCFLLRYQETRDVRHLLFALFFAACTLFFRIAIFAMLIISVAIALIARESNKKGLLRWIFIGVLGGSLLLSFVVGILYGKDIEAVLAVTESRAKSSIKSIGGTLTWIVSGLSVIFGPYANFVKMIQYAIVHSSGLLLKGVMGYPMLVGLWIAIRQYSWRYYTLLTYFLLHAIMVVVCGVSLDLRYQITLFPLTLPFILKSWQERKNNRFFFLVYFVVLFGLTWFYNKR